MKTMYKIDSKGKVREWSIEVDSSGRYRTISGLVDGAKVTSEWTYATPTNVGRSNERDAIAQAVFEGDSIIAEKRNDNYQDSIDAAKGLDKPFEPMLANKFKSWDKLPSKSIFSQPKLDGIRCIASKNGFLTRNKKPINSIPFIGEVLQDFFADNPHIILDGELYNHVLRDNFNMITSLVRRDKDLTVEESELAKANIEYHIYDLYDTKNDLPYSERRIMLQDFFRRYELAANPFTRYVESLEVSNEYALFEQFENYMTSGYEGQMIRLPNGLYDQKRSNNLLKHKPEGIDTEYEIRNVLEGQGNWSMKAKMIECALPDGRLFRATVKGTMDYLSMVWIDRESYIGKQATVWCQNLTPDGIPRFPIAKELDRSDI
jgi:DNA ligase-1